LWIFGAPGGRPPGLPLFVDFATGGVATRVAAFFAELSLAERWLGCFPGTRFGSNLCCFEEATDGFY
jgi:hypothetical protein